MGDLPGMEGPALQALPQIEYRLTFLYLEHRQINREDSAILILDDRGTTGVPAAAITVLLLGPGTTVTHRAVELIGDAGVGIVWVGEHGVRFYAGGRPLTYRAHLLMKQAKLVSNQRTHLAVVRKMYQLRFPNEDVSGLTTQQLRGQEGSRVRKTYRTAAEKWKIPWNGREFDPDNFSSEIQSIKPSQRGMPACMDWHMPSLWHADAPPLIHGVREITSEEKVGIAHADSKAAIYQRNRRIQSARQKARQGSDYTVLDLETTGLSHLKDHIIEIAALEVRNERVVGQFHTLVQCPVPIPAVVSKLTGLSDAQLMTEGRPIVDVWKECLIFIGSDLLVIHHASFDYSFLQADCKKVGLSVPRNQCMDTLKLARQKLSKLDGYSLEDVSFYFGLNVAGHHRALKDCELTLEIYQKLKEIWGQSQIPCKHHLRCE